MNIAFWGYRHGHTGAIYKEAKMNAKINIVGAFEAAEEGRKLAESVGVEFNYSSAEELLADERVDIVNIGGYYTERGAQAIAALRAGKHVFCDKPLCTSLQELDEIEALAKEKNLFVGCDFTMRFENGMRTVREMIMRGDIGEIGAINLTGQHALMYGSRPMWYFEEGKHGGTINDIAIHAVDLVRFISGLGVKKATAARTWNHFATEVPHFHDCGQFMAELDNGAGFTGDVSYAAPASCGPKLETYWRFTVWGTKGVIEYKYKGGPKTENDDERRVFVALEGSDGFVAVPKSKYETSGLSEFIKEVGGEKNLLSSTVETFKSTRDTLRIQAAVK
ncbi:MAG: Gfo/Idh/MocA family oxidoreductase [Oscillospiraceae bacterium]|nr:Gfo/Idh/MocA family oxidoreductase [Oscillospiraceae bacterium]MBQ6901649.1 Gfo/Idh/MocA family oxidoreductase [Oscillospiraceae bacterium]